MEGIIDDKLKPKLEDIKAKISVDKEKVSEANKLFYKPDKTAIDISKLFLFCKDFLTGFDELREYADQYNDFDKLSTLIYKTEKKIYGWHQFERKINEIVELNRPTMMGLIFKTQEIFKLFSELVDKKAPISSKLDKDINSYLEIK